MDHCNIKKMKTTRVNTRTRNIFLGILIITIAVSGASCSRKITFLNSSVVPAAQGYVKVKRDQNENYVIQMHIEDLAEVERLQSPNQTYVIWMVTDGGMTKNIGQLNSSRRTLSNKLNASFETVSSFKPERIFITAEEDSNTQYPGRQVVLSTDRF